MNCKRKTLLFSICFCLFSITLCYPENIFEKDYLVYKERRDNGYDISIYYPKTDSFEYVDAVKMSGISRDNTRISYIRDEQIEGSDTELCIYNILKKEKTVIPINVNVPAGYMNWSLDDKYIFINLGRTLHQTVVVLDVQTGKEVYNFICYNGEYAWLDNDTIVYSKVLGERSDSSLRKIGVTIKKMNGPERDLLSPTKNYNYEYLEVVNEKTIKVFKAGLHNKPSKQLVVNTNGIILSTQKYGHDTSSKNIRKRESITFYTSFREDREIVGVFDVYVIDPITFYSFLGPKLFFYSIASLRDDHHHYWIKFKIVDYDSKKEIIGWKQYPLE